MLVLTRQAKCHSLLLRGLWPWLHSVDCDQFFWSTSLQLLLYSNESIICSICPSAVLHTVHFKGSLQMKASPPFPVSPLFLSFSVWEKYGSPRFDANDEVFSPPESRVVTWSRDIGRLQTGFFGVPRLWWRNGATAKCLIFVISVISEKPGVKLFLAPQFKPLLFIFWPWN